MSKIKFDLQVGHSRVKNQKFIEITDIPASNIFSKADGVVGLGFKANDINPFIYNLIQQTKIKQPIFSIYLSR